MSIVAPSVLSANFAELNKDIEKINNSKAEWIHFDVMDGHFVPNHSFGVPILNAINKLTNRFMDVHIMVEDPIKFIDIFDGCKIDNLTFHYEAISNNLVGTCIDKIKSKGYKCGISIKPNTDVKVLKNYLEKVDVVLVMSVEPGFGNQKFIHSATEKIAWLDEYRKKNQLNYLIEVDGGINDQTGEMVKQVGCDVLVSGSYLFKYPLGFDEGVKTLL